MDFVLAISCIEDAFQIESLQKSSPGLAVYATSGINKRPWVDCGKPYKFVTIAISIKSTPSLKRIRWVRLCQSGNPLQL